MQSQFMVDDFHYLENKTLNLYYPHFADFFVRSLGHHYNPLDVALNFYLFKYFPFPAILYGFNLLIFTLNSFLLYVLTSRLTQNSHAAFITSVLFIIHPLNADNINHITFNSVLLSALFLQASMLLFWNVLNATKTDKYQYFISLLMFGIALLLLETAIFFPAYLILICLLRKSKLTSLSLTLPYWLISILYFLLWCLMTTGKNLSFSIPLSQYLATATFLVKWYLGNILIAYDPIFIKSTPVLTENLTVWICGFILGIGLVFYFIWKFRKSAHTIFLIWFLIGFLYMLPATLVQSRSMGMIIEPHWFYFSSMGIFIFIGLIFLQMQSRIKAIFYNAFVFSIIIFFALTSYRHHLIAKTERQYLEYWLLVSPGNPIPALKLGYLYGLEPTLLIPKALIEEMQAQSEKFLNAKLYTETRDLLKKLTQSAPEHQSKKLWESQIFAINLQTGQITADQFSRFLQSRRPVENDLILAIELNRLGLKNEAFALLDQGLKNDPQNAELVYLKAVFLANENHFGEAQGLLAPLRENPKIKDLILEIEKISQK